MDTRTGEILTFENEKDLKKAIADQKRDDFGFLTQINRELTPMEIDEKKIGRNSPCGCGSRKKFKKCCWTGRKLTDADRADLEKHMRI